MSAYRLRRIYRVIGLAFGLAAAIILLTALAIQFQIRVANSWQQYSKLPAAKAPSKTDSIIVFAPHADDETLGCGGMLATACKNGARTRVVLLTNGDGFWFAASRTYRTIRITPDRLISFACRRQQETLKAMKTQGVSASQVTFLGYPDRGLSHLWNEHWSPDSLYTSSATGLCYSPYANSHTLHAPYCGENVLKDISSVLKSTKPTDIYVPHPLDNHPDHYATYCFVTAAVEQLRSEGFEFAKKIRTHTYLVHRGDWPVPRGEQPNQLLVPPYAIAQGDTRWESLALSPEVAKLKREAILEYKTQTNVEKDFLMSFAKPNELFGSLPDRKVARVKTGTITIDGDQKDWMNIPPSIVDPVGDYVMAGMNGGGDVRAIYTCSDGESLFVRLDCARNLSSRVRYTITLRGINDHGSNDFYTISLKPQAREVAGVSDWAYRNNVLEMSLPMDKLGKDSDLFIQVRTTTLNLTVDNTGWHPIEIGNPKVSQKPDTKTPV